MRFLIATVEKHFQFQWPNELLLFRRGSLCFFFFAGTMAYKNVGPKRPNANSENQPKRQQEISHSHSADMEYQQRRVAGKAGGRVCGL